MKYMKKVIGKRLLSGMMSAVLTVTALPLASLTTPQKEVKAASVILQNPRIVKDDSMKAGQKVIWDSIWFGSYPQREVVKDENTYCAINSGYYDSEKDVIEDSVLFQKLESASEWDNKNEIVIDGKKYRRIQKADAVHVGTDTSTMGKIDGYYDWEDDVNWHYFRYDPVKWRVLDISNNEVFLMADIALDTQTYNDNFVNVTWENSGIRSWLNGYGSNDNQEEKDYSEQNFIDSCFNESEKNAICTTNVVNNNNINYNTNGGNNTEDKVFLLSEEELYNSDKSGIYGFANSYGTNDEARECKSSTYAKAMGTWTWSDLDSSYIGNCWWWLRSPGCQESYGAGGGHFCDVSSYGIGVIFYGSIRPALKLDISYEDLWDYAGEVSSFEESEKDDSNSRVPFEKTKWTATAGSEENNGLDGPASNAIDGDETTIWHSKYSDSSSTKGVPDIVHDKNNEFTIDFGESITINELEYIARSGSSVNGVITKYKILYSTTPSGDDFIELANGAWEANKKKKSVRFADTAMRRIQIRAMETIADIAGQKNKFISAAEFNVYKIKDNTQETETDIKETETMESETSEERETERQTESEPQTEDKLPLEKVIATGDTNQIVLSWTLAHEIDIAGYYIYRKAENEDSYTLIKKISDRNVLSYTDATVKEKQKYYYYITVADSNGVEGKPSEIVEAIPLADTEAPRVVQIIPANGSIISGNVDLHANAEDNIAVVKTELYISEDGEQTWTLLKAMDNNYCNYTLDTKKCEDKIIYIKGLAYDKGENVSVPLICSYQIDNTGPEKVTGLSYESTATTITLKWKDVSDKDFAFFRVEQKKDENTFEKVEDVKSTLGINIYNLESEKEYTYRVIAYDQQGNRGEESDEITVETKPDTSCPVITSIQPNANYYKEKIPLCVTATDNTGVAGMLIQTSDNTVVWKDYKSFTFNGKNKTESLKENILLDGIEEGNLYVRAIATDIAGNKSDSSDKAPYVQYIIDRTAPQIPKNLKADAITGAIQLTWNMGSENDIDGYQVLRSMDGKNYTAIAEGLHSVNYWDRSAEKDITYWYKITVSDQAGNISAATEPVNSVLPEDQEPPKIENFAPASGDIIGISNSKFSIMASDNWKLDKISVGYTINDNAEIKTLINETGIDNYYKVSNANIPLEDLKDGDILHLTVSVTDVQGMCTSKEGIEYVVDKTAPTVNSVLTESAENKIIVKWSGNAEEDLAGYRIYRKRAEDAYVLIAQKSAGTDTEYQYEDYNAFAKEIYYYKIEAVDKYGNTYSKESKASWITIKSVLSANLNCDKTLERNTEYYFDASNSRSDTGIVSYKYDFGDGTIISGVEQKVVHKYVETGDYTVHLIITDKQGNQSEIEKKVVVEEPKLLGTVKIKIVDVSGNPLSDMPIYFDMDHTSDSVKYTDLDGVATFNASAGYYTVGSYANGYLPVKKSLTIKAGTEVSLTFTVIKEPIVTGKFEVNRMTLDEIKAAGIDVSDPANQQVVKIKIHLVYGSTPVTMNVITNGNKIYSEKNTIIDTGAEKRQLTTTVISSNTSGKLPGVNIGAKSNNVIIAIMDVPVEASSLKEFFDVKLHIINHADKEFELKNNTVKLNVPDGITLMDSNYTTKDNIVYFDSLTGQQQKTLSWILCGDRAGKYNLTADYSAVLQQFNAVVNAQFKTDTPITVYGLNAMKLVADIDSKIIYGGMYFNLSLQNISDVDMNLPTLNIEDQIQSLYEKKAGESYSSEEEVPKGEIKKREVKLLDVLLKNSTGYSQSLGSDGTIEKLSKGEYITKKYVSYNVTNEDIAYLQNAVAEVASDLGIEVEVNKVDMDLYSIDDADEKAQSFYTDLNKNNMYKFIIDNNNFHYYIDAENDDENYLKRLGMTIYGVTDFFINKDTDVFNHKNMKDTTRKYVAEMLMDESFQTAVDNKIDDTYLKTAKQIISAVNGALPEDKSGILYEDTTVQDIKNTLKESKNIRTLAGSLKNGGSDAFWDRLLALTLSVGGSAGVTYLKKYVQQNMVAGWFAQALKGELSEISSILSVFSDAGVAWNRSVEVSNQLVTINAAQYESLLLMNMLLSHDEINKFVYEELQEIKKGLINGFETQSAIFAEEFAKAEIKGLTANVVSLVSGLIKKQYFAGTNAVTEIVFLALKLSFGAFDYLFGWGKSVDKADSLRVAASLTYALRSETIRMRSSKESEKFLMALKYLTKIRMIGENTWVNLCKESKATAVKPGFSGEKQQTLEAYIAVFKSTLLSYRDTLFGEVSEIYNIPKAPAVNLDCANEITREHFSDSYEYSFNGSDWIACNGKEIALEPGNVGKHLWVRERGTKENLAGNITKIYVPARPVISGDLKVYFKNGSYYVIGLYKDTYYKLTDEKADTITCDQKIKYQNDEMVITNVGEYYTYLALVIPGTDSVFRSQVRNIAVEKAKKIMLENNKNEGEVSGADEYFEGDIVTIKAIAKEGYEFIGWYEGNQCISTQKEYSFKCHDDQVIEAKFEQANNVKVTFKGWNQTLLKSDIYAFDLNNPTEIIIPNAPILDGYKFTGWILNNQIYTSNTIQEAIWNRLIERKSIQVEAKYVQSDEKHTLSIIHGRISDGNTSGEYRTSTLITIMADEAEAGKKFVYWKKDGVIVGYEKTYRFYMPNMDTELEAVYENVDISVKTSGISYIESITKNVDIRKISFVSIGTVPDGCCIEYSGIVATSNPNKATNGTALTSANADYVRGGGQGYKTCKYTWTKGNVTDNQTWYVRSYLKYKDKSGKIHEIYSEVYSISF